MFCQKCGNQLNEGAAFCPKCGSKVDASSSIPIQTVTAHIVEPEKPKKRKRGIIIVSLIVAICLLYFIVGTSDNKTVNAGKGADDPAAIGQAYVLSCQYRDTSYIDRYLDDEFKSDSFITRMQDDIQELDELNINDINMDGVICELGATYEEAGYTCVDITVLFAEKGLFGGNTILGDSFKIVIPLHKANTPDGMKWFVGKPKSPYYEDETGLRKSQ